MTVPHKTLHQTCVNNFDWNTQDPRIGFKDNMLIAVEGSVGYGIGGARVEVEVGYERFKTRGIRDSGSKEDEGDTVYLLAKELVYDVLTDQTDKLAAALAKVSGKDIVAFAQALKASDPKVEQQICKETQATSGSHSGVAGWNNSTYAKCHLTTQQSSGGTKTGLDAFVQASIKEKPENWPKASAAGNNDNAKQVAEDLMKLGKDDKAVVATHLANTVEGGEVVEIRSVSSTSVMVNACYDLLSEGINIKLSA